MAKTKATNRRPLPKKLKNLISLLKNLILKTGTLEVLHLFTLLSVRYLPNRSSVYWSEMLLPIALLAPLILLTYYLYFRLFKNSLTAHIATFSMLYVDFHFGYHFSSSSSLAVGLSPVRLSTDFRVAVAVFGLKFILSGLIALAFNYVYSRFKIAKTIPLMKLMAFVVIFIALSQAYKFTDYNLRISDQTSFEYQLPNYKQDKSKIVSKPDIYYFVFDRYASNSWLRSEYGFDNSELTNFLESQGFSVKDDALSNYPFTVTSVSSTMAMEYHDQPMGHFKNKTTTFPLRSILNNPPVAQLLKKNGYQYTQIASWWGTTSDKINADYNLTSKPQLNLLGAKTSLTEFQKLFSDTSALSYLYKPVLKNTNIDERRRPIEQIEKLKSISKSDISTPKFVFTHVLSPHSPYLFDENGAKPTYDQNSNDEGVDEKVKYVNQLKYVNTLIKDAITAIRQNNPGAIIVLQADEGPYPSEIRGKNYNHLETIESLSDHGLKSKYVIQAAYYFPNKNSATKINSSIDAFRVTLSDYLGYDIPSLPSCQYSGRTLVNTRLGVPLSPECPVFDR